MFHLVLPRTGPQKQTLKHSVYLILAIDTTRAVTRCTLSIGNHIEASLTTSTIRVSKIKLAFTDRDIFFLLLLVPIESVKKMYTLKMGILLQKRKVLTFDKRSHFDRCVRTVAPRLPLDPFKIKTFRIQRKPKSKSQPFIR